MNWHDRRATAAHHDHARDLRKHDPRPGEKDYVPLCAQSAPLSEAMEVAVLAQAIPLHQAAQLIEQYARTVAAAAQLETAADALHRVEVITARALETPLTRKVP